MQRQQLIHESITRSIIGAFYEVYNYLGFGFLERIYSRALEIELRARGHKVDREVWVPVYYKNGELLGKQRMDMVVDEAVIAENKSTISIPPSTPRQLNSYLRSTPLRVGLIL